MTKQQPQIEVFLPNFRNAISDYLSELVKVSSDFVEKSEVIDKLLDILGNDEGYPIDGDEMARYWSRR